MTLNCFDFIEELNSVFTTEFTVPLKKGKGKNKFYQAGREQKFLRRSEVWKFHH